MEHYDAAVIGAGGAGLMCALQAGRRGKRVLLIDHSPKIGSKILISGGGRCNFTNLATGPENYLSQNPHFSRSALSRFTPQDFVQMVRDHGIPYHEKKLGQLFCDRSAQDIVAMLEEECRRSHVEFRLGAKVLGVDRPDRFILRTGAGDLTCDSLVIATGGLSIPKLGATDFGYRIAGQFGLRVVETAPALDGFRLKQQFNDLTGVSADAIVTCGKHSFRENILFTHAGLSGPAALQASLYWRPGNQLLLNFLPRLSSVECVHWFTDRKKGGSRSELGTLLKEWLPGRLADRLCRTALAEPHASLQGLSAERIRDFCAKLQNFPILPLGTVGYGKAEVTRGGVDTDELSSKTMECKKVKGLYFIGEVLDVTGQLGGFNFQWAWASGYTAGQAV